MGHNKRLGVKIDMTPMVDVAFLLLIFFMSTTQFKPPEEVSVNLPSCTSEFKVPESGIIVLTVTKDDKIYIGNETGEGSRSASENPNSAGLSSGWSGSLCPSGSRLAIR